MSGPRLSRRGLAGLALGAAAAGGLGAAALLGGFRWRGDPGGADLSFPTGFRWGVATSAYQVEGAAREDGRGPSIWDTFCREPDRIRDNSNGDIACDHYHRYPEDIGLMKELGVTAYRFSIAWPRLFPDGGRVANPKGIAFYDRLVDALLANGIEPVPTLYHWDLPQALQDRGGWRARDTAQALADYAAYSVRKLSDRVGRWFTLNEMMTFIEEGYGRGRFAPGQRLPRADLNQARHHAVLAHGLAVQAMRAAASRKLAIGPAENPHVVIPAVETEADIRAAEIATREMNAGYLTVMMEGRYTDRWLAIMGNDAPRFTAEELKTISTPVDFVGLNVYTPGAFVRATDAEPGYMVVPFPPSYPRMEAPWLFFGPEALYWAPRHVSRLWKVPEIYITENGTAAADKPAADGRIYDVDRVMYLRQYLAQLRRAIVDGAPVRGYYAWSLMDNFEWHDGYLVRFGLYHVDFETQKRTPKLSADFYRQLVSGNRLV